MDTEDTRDSDGNGTDQFKGGLETSPSSLPPPQVVHLCFGKL